MNLELSATANSNSTIKLFCNNEQIYISTANNFIIDTTINTQEKNVLDIHWLCDQQENVNFSVQSILINEQKIDIHKSMYLPFSQPKGYAEYVSHHCGRLVWPGILRVYFQILKQQEYRLKKIQDSTMFRKYNIIYDQCV